MNQDNLLPKNCTLLFSKETIQQHINTIAATLNTEYHNQPVVFLTIMNGGMIFASDLAKMLNLDMEMDYVQVSRYGTETTGGQLIWKHQCETSLQDKHVILVDDIFDEGYTLMAVDEWCKEQGAKTVKSVVLVVKQHERGYADFKVDYHGIEVEDLYIFGYGMDYQEKLRHLNDIYYLN
ncbi:Hypoxanthine-guanine phosphoribosyltransferase [hydrothermal vent metagenome]|uniref:Hypoxanthine-guanine phosphoribosyltransferase n=1 Tax=hydrothermal vent metagenome TaxID=652676 RepID=A0A3B0UWH0_9ZZZZ